MPKASVQLVDHDRVLEQTISGSDGWFRIRLSAAGQFVVKVEASGFRPVEQPIRVALSGNLEITLKMTQLAPRTENVSVTADLNETDVLSPDPAERVFVLKKGRA